MQLGEVYQEDADAPPPQPPPKRRWLLWLSALGALAGALFVHGPGVMWVPGQTVLVVTNDTGWSFLGAPARVARNSPGLAFWVPIAQHAHPIALRRNRPAAVEFVAHTQDGMRLPVRDVTLTYRVDAQLAAAVFMNAGGHPKDWDPRVQAQLVKAWIAAIKREDAALLARRTPKDLVPAVERRLRRDLAPLGFEVLSVGVPRWSPDPVVDAALAALEAAQTTAQTAEQTAIDAVAEAARADAALQAERDTQWRGLQAILEAQREGAQLQGAAQVEQARQDATDRIRHARAQRAERIARARTVRATTASRVLGLKAQVDAARIAGPQLLDEAILQHVLPQLEKNAEHSK